MTRSASRNGSRRGEGGIIVLLIITWQNVFLALERNCT